MSSAAASAPDVRLGVSRFELRCGPHVEDALVQLVRRWGWDRALPVRALDHLCDVLVAALEHAITCDPGSVVAELSWADPDRVRVTVQWQADDWSAGNGPPALCVVLDTRQQFAGPSGPVGQQPMPAERPPVRLR